MTSSNDLKIPANFQFDQNTGLLSGLASAFCLYLHCFKHACLLVYIFGLAGTVSTVKGYFWTVQMLDENSACESWGTTDLAV